MSQSAGQLTLVADLGHFTLESDVALASSLSAEKASLYECLKLDGRDLSAYLVDGEFSFTALKQLGRPVSEAEGIDTQTQPAGKVGHGGTSIFVPLLDRCGLKAALQAARYPHPSFPQIQTQLQVASLNFFFSPARMARLMRVLKAALPGANYQHFHPFNQFNCPGKLGLRLKAVKLLSCTTFQAEQLIEALQQASCSDAAGCMHPKWI